MWALQSKTCLLITCDVSAQFLGACPSPIRFLGSPSCAAELRKVQRAVLVRIDLYEKRAQVIILREAPHRKPVCELIEVDNLGLRTRWRILSVRPESSGDCLHAHVWHDVSVSVRDIDVETLSAS